MDTDEVERLTPPRHSRFTDEVDEGCCMPEKRRILLGKRISGYIGVDNAIRWSDYDKDDYNGSSHRLRGKPPRTEPYQQEEVITRRYADPRTTRNHTKVEPLDTDLPVLGPELDLLNALGVSLDQISTPGVCGLRSEALHLIGVSSLNTAGVFELLSPGESQADRNNRLPLPQWIEWIDDNTCNAVYAGWRPALSALGGLCGLSAENDDDIDVCVRSGSPCLRCIRPGLLVRFALNADRKNKNANRDSKYYKKHGNPNYDNMPGLLSYNYRRRINLRRSALEMRHIAERGAPTVAAGSLTTTVPRRRVLNGAGAAKEDVRRTHSPHLPSHPKKRLRPYCSPSPSPPRQRIRKRLSDSPVGRDLRFVLQHIRTTREELDPLMFNFGGFGKARSPIESPSRQVFFLVKTVPPSSSLHPKEADRLSIAPQRSHVQRDYLEARHRASDSSRHLPQFMSDTPSRISSTVQIVQRPTTLEEQPPLSPPPPQSVVGPNNRSHRMNSPYSSLPGTRSSLTESSSLSDNSCSDSGTSSSSSSSSSGSSSKSKDSVDDTTSMLTTKTAPAGDKCIGGDISDSSSRTKN